MKQYIKPTTQVIKIGQTSILCSSAYFSEEYCTEACKIWHICQDREFMKKCRDKIRKH